MCICYVLKKGDLVGCLGGDEFVVVLKSVKNKNDVIEVVDKLKVEICKLFIYNDVEFIYLLSIGVVLFLEYYGDVEYLI